MDNGGRTYEHSGCKPYNACSLMVLQSDKYGIICSTGFYHVSTHHNVQPTIEITIPINNYIYDYDQVSSEIFKTIDRNGNVQKQKVERCYGFLLTSFIALSYSGMFLGKYPGSIVEAWYRHIHITTLSTMKNRWSISKSFQVIGKH